LLLNYIFILGDFLDKFFKKNVFKLQPLLRWAIICSVDNADMDGQEDSCINYFLTQLRETARNNKYIGQSINEAITQPDVYQVMNKLWKTKEDVIKAIPSNAKEKWKNYQIVLFVLPQKAKLLYDVIKQATNKDLLCIPTQCMVSKNLKQTNDSPILMGLWLQMQSKVFFFIYIT
jgi:hypothetical protein